MSNDQSFLLGLLVVIASAGILGKRNSARWRLVTGSSHYAEYFRHCVNLCDGIPSQPTEAVFLRGNLANCTPLAGSFPLFFLTRYPESIISALVSNQLMTISSHANTTLSRREKILEMLRHHGFVSILDLRDALEVSESTIRRDLEVLEESGEAKRTHGGVFSTGPSNSVRQFDSKKGNWDLKRSIAILAAQQIDDHETILLDGGSTTYELARQLVGRPLQIVTNSLPVANLFATNDQVDLVLLGGFVHHKTGVTIGKYANEMLTSLNVQKAFLSVAGVSEKGFYNSNGLLVETERAMMQAADRSFIIADSSKFGRSSLAKLCDWSQVHTLISDDQLESNWLNLANKSGVSVRIASLAKETGFAQTVPLSTNSVPTSSAS